MSRKAIVAIFLVVAIVIATLVVWKLTFKKSDITMALKKTDVEIEASVLTHEFESNEDSANARYLGKILSVSGTISSISEEEQKLTIYLKNPDDISGTMCTLDKASVDKNLLKVGELVKIKGICDGYLMDVKLNKCSLEE